MRAFRRFAWFGLVLGACGVVAGRPGLEPEDHPITGTYDVQFCRGPCDPRRPDLAMVTGTLVLEEERYSLSELPAAVVARMERSDFILTVIDSERSPNACFVLSRSDRARTYAGLTENGVTRWEADSTGTLRFPLFHSPDAGYVVEVAVDGRELRGQGRSWGVGDARVDFPVDSIYGRRVGPPDRRTCLRAMESEAEASVPRSGA